MIFFVYLHLIVILIYQGDPIIFRKPKASILLNFNLLLPLYQQITYYKVDHLDLSICGSQNSICLIKFPNFLSFYLLAVF